MELRRRSPIVRILILLLALPFIAMPAQAASWIICLGDDGHVDFEWVEAGRCCPGENPWAATGFRSASEAPCGECLDVLVGSGIASENGMLSSRPLETPALPAQVAVLPAKTSPLPAAFSPADHPALALSVNPLLTTRLLI